MYNKKTFFYLLIFLAVLIRFGYIFFIGNKLPMNDAAGYDRLGWTLAKHGEFSYTQGEPTFRRAPGYPFFLSLIYRVFGHTHIVARIFQGLISLLTCGLIYLLGKRLFDKKTGLLAALISLFYPFFIYYTGELLVETLFVFLVTLSLYYLVISQTCSSFKILILTGLVLGLTTLCKPTILPFAVISMGTLVLLWGVKRIKSYRGALIIFLIFLIPSFFWAIRNKNVFGHFIIMHSGSGRELLGSSYSYDIKVNGQAFRDMIATTDDPVWARGRMLPAMERDKYYFRQGLKFIRQHPARFIQLAFKKFIKFWRLHPTVEYIEGSQARKRFIILASLFSYGLLLPFSLFGLILSIKEWRKFILLYLLLLIFTFVHMVFWAQVRYRLPLMPVMIIFSSVGLLKFFGKKSIFNFLEL